MDTGGKIRTGNILKHLAQKHRITLISNVESPKDDAHIPSAYGLCDRFVQVPWKEVKRYSPLFFGRLFLQMFSIYPVNVLNDTSVALRKAVEKELAAGTYDLAICDFVQSALMFKHVVGVPTVLFQHNVESVIIRRQVDRATNPLIRFFWWLQWKKMLRFEAKACHRFNRVIAVSQKDRQQFESLYGLDNVSEIPTGVDIDYFKPMPDMVEKPHSMVFCGSMDWLPNVDAMDFFIKSVFPKIKSEVPDATLTIVGRNPPTSLRRLAEASSSVDLTGWVEDTRPHIARCSVVIVPIRIGGGTRMKIYEAMAMGKAIVSTTIGAEGLPVSIGRNIVIADEIKDMAIKVIDLFTNRDNREFIGDNALTFVRQHFAWSSVADKFEKACLK